MPSQTMDDLARETGLSKMTVSRVFSGAAPVREATRLAVLEAARRLGYEYNALAGSFSSGKSGLVGIALVVNELLGSQYFSSLFTAVQEVLDRHGYGALLLDMGLDRFATGRSIERYVAQKRVEGVLAFAPPRNSAEFLKTFSRQCRWVVVVGGHPDDAGVPCVTLDNHHAIEVVIKHLLAYGHRRIGFISGSKGMTDAEDRRAAFHELRRQHDLQWNEGWEACGAFTWRGGRSAMQEILGLRVPPTAVIAANDLSALGASDALRERGLVPGRDVSIAGIDNERWSLDSHPQITTVAQPLDAMGRQAAEMLVDRLRGGGGGRDREPIVMRGTLLPRESTGRALS